MALVDIRNYAVVVYRIRDFASRQSKDDPVGTQAVGIALFSLLGPMILIILIVGSIFGGINGPQEIRQRKNRESPTTNQSDMDS